MKSEDVKNELRTLASDYDAVNLAWFFKTGPGEYGEGDVFIGVRMGPIREVAKKFSGLDISELKKLVASPVHEHRMCALIITTNKYKKSSELERKQIYDFYINALNDGYVNNWDLIDVTCEHIVGEYLRDKPKDVLYELAVGDLWHRRVAVIATFAYIKSGQSQETIKIVEMLMNDQHDLIHKAVGWMLREIGKRVDINDLLDFLDQNAHKMPRTMLRYSIEKLDSVDKAKYMNQKG